MKIHVTNRRSKTIVFQTEPWGDFVSIEPTCTVEVELTLPELGAVQFEVEDDRVVLSSEGPDLQLLRG
jgi:hypothetical protein